MSELPKRGISKNENALSKYLNNESVLVNDYYYDVLKRKELAIDDVCTVYKKSDTITLHHTTENSYISKIGLDFNPQIKKSESLEDLFT